MKKSVIFIMAIIMIAVSAGIGVLWYVQSNEPDYTTVRFIKGYQKSKNNFSDISGAINVTGVDDIGYVIEGKMRLRIKYGDQTIKVSPRAFEDEKFIKELAGIGIEIKYRVNPDTGALQYRVTYWDEPVTLYEVIN